MKKLFFVLGIAFASTQPAFAFTAWRTDAACTNSFCTAEFKAQHSSQTNGLAQIGADLAYETLAQYGIIPGQGVTVGIVDSGVLLTHQEFAGKISSLQTTIYQGKPLNETSGDHGTHVAGIVAAAKDDNTMHGVAYGASIVGFSALGSFGTENSWRVLATSAFDSVKINNNSWGWTNWQYFVGSSTPTPTGWLNENLTDARALVAKDKLIVAAASNDTQVSPNTAVAGLPYYDDTLKNNIISVIAYDSNKNPSNPDFLASFSNLAKHAEHWSVSAPGDWYILSTTNTGDTDYDLMGGTSMASPMVAGAAAVVSSAFPFMGGKQIADTILSNAYRGTDGNWEGFANYYLQHNVLDDPADSRKGIKVIRYLIPEGSNASVFTHMSPDSLSCSSSYDSCSIQIYYNEQLVSTDGANYNTWDGQTLSYESIFGQGLLDLDSAVKGPKTFDANRLTAADYKNGEWYYTVNVNKGQEGIPFAHNITQTKNTTTNTTANVGLKKTGTGELAFSGTQEWLGKTIIEGGTLKLENSAILKGSAVEIETNGTLAGTGTVQDTSEITNKGTLFSTVKVANLQNEGGVIYFNSLNDKLTISTTNNLQSGTLAFNMDTLKTGTYTLLQSGSGNLNIESGFALPTYDDMAFYNFTYDTSDATKVNLTIDKYSLSDDAPYSEPLSAQDKSVAQALEAQANAGNTDFNAYYLESEEGIKQKIRRMRTQVQSVSLESLPLADKITNNVYTHLFNISHGNATPSNASRGRYSGYRGRSGGTASLDDKIWIQAVGGKSEVKADKQRGIGKFESTLFGAMAGVDFEINKNLLVGLTMGYAKTKTRQDDDKMNIHDYRGGLYFSAKEGLFSLNGIILGGYQEYKGIRRTGAAFDINIGKRYNGWSAEGSLNAGADFYLLGRPTRGSNRSLFLHVRPYVSGSWQRKYQDSYRETGHSAFVLQVEDATDTSVTGQTGMMIGIGGQRFEFMLDAGYQRLIQGDIPLVSAYFVSDATQTSFQSVGEEGDKDFLSLGGGFDIRFTDKFALNLWLDNKLSENTRSHTGTITLKWFF